MGAQETLSYLETVTGASTAADMQKHPSSLARLAEIFLSIGGNICKTPPLLCADISGKLRKLRQFGNYFFHLIKKILFHS